MLWLSYLQNRIVLPHPSAFHSPTGTVSISLSSTLTLSFHIQNVVKVCRSVDSVSPMWLLRPCPHFSVYWLPLLASCKDFSCESSTCANAHIPPCHTWHTLLHISPLKTRLPACPWHSGLPFLMPV